jgi:hypothetical protein
MSTERILKRGGERETIRERYRRVEELILTYCRLLATETPRLL